MILERGPKAGWLLEEELNKYIKELEVANPNLAIIARLRKLTQVSGKEENMKEADKDLLPEKDMRPYTVAYSYRLYCLYGYS